MSAEHSTKHIVQALLVNVVIAAAKGIAAAVTGSGALLAEAIHSGADCSNQLLLLLGVRRSARAPDDSHPLGYGRVMYFWSFMVALLLFTGGGVFSVYEGIHKLSHPEAMENAWVGLGILGLSLALEAGSTIGNILELNRRRGATGFFAYLRETKDSALVVIFGENSAATLGLVGALAAVIMATYTGDPAWDALGTVVVGLVLIGVAIFLAVETQSLLVGERADPKIEAAVAAVAAAQPDVVEALRVITLQQGQGEVMVAAKLRLHPNLDTAGVCAAINRFEVELRGRCPQIRWSFIEPDLAP